jgi:acetyltransferase
MAHSVEECVHVAERVTYPVAMKVVSAQVVHKSDVGGVQLNLATPDQVRDAYELMMLRVQRRLPNAEIEGVYIERMSKPGREVILGMHRDPQFGPMLMFGLGGIFVEVMKDVSFYLAPLTEEEALQMLVRTRSYALLTGVRGQRSVDLQALASCIQRVSQLATDFPQILELDINPLIVREAGMPPTVADARMTFAECEAHEHQTSL